MNIISQFYKDLLKNRIIFEINNISNELANNIVNNLFNTDINKYLNLISSIQSNAYELIRNVIVTSFENIDEQYKNSNLRKKYYSINKSNVPRTLVTIFGDITYKRTYYKSKLDGSYHFMLDELFELPSYDHYDPIIKGIAIDKAFSTNQQQSGKDTGELFTNIALLSSENRYINQIPRQSIYNWIKKWNVPKYVYKEAKTPSTLYIMADEKYIGCQDLEKDIMTKCFVSFEGIERESKNRNKLINRTVFSTYSITPWIEFLDTITQKYDFTKINNIYIIGDGGTWIRKGLEHMKIEPKNVVKYLLCTFHFKQAINRITTDKDERILLNDSFNNKKKKEFINDVKELLNKYPEREQIINKNLDYIINNYAEIKNMIKNDVGSSMESHISHLIANTFASRPKGYSSKNIKKYLTINDFKNNNLNILNIYFQSYNKTTQININDDTINNFSLTNNKGTNIPIIDDGNLSGCYTFINNLLH